MIKRTYSRRGFIGMTGAGVAGNRRELVATSRRGPSKAQDADLVVFNAKVYNR